MLNLIIAAAVFVIAVSIFIIIALKIKRRGGSMFTTVVGGTYEFLNEEKREAVEILVEQKANKKMEEQSSHEPKVKFND